MVDGLDEAILNAVKDGKRKFFEVLAAVHSVAVSMSERPKDADRLVDRRLQKLRRDGALVFKKGGKKVGGGWHLAGGKE